MNRRLIPILLLSLASGAAAQVVGPELRVGSGLEPAIAASRVSGDVIIAWQSSAQLLYYSVSLDSGLNFGASQNLYPPQCAGTNTGFDPMAARSHWTGDLWIGGIAHATLGPVFVARKPQGATSILPTSVVPITDCPQVVPGLAWDKGFIAVGPREYQQAGNAEAMYAAWKQHGASDTIYNSRSTNGGLPGEFWPTTPQKIVGPPPETHRDGKGTFPLVIQGAGAENHRGRVLVAHSAPPILDVFPPVVTFSDDGGIEGTWSSPPSALNVYGNPPSPILGVEGQVAQNVKVTTWSLGFAANPVNPNVIAVAFPGRGQVGGNTDIFIAVSEDAGETFPAANIHRFTDEDLRIPDERPGTPSHEFMASLVFDNFQGLNLMYARCPVVASINEESPVSIAYARWSNIQALGAAPSFKARFSDPFTAINVGHDANDYHMLSHSGCVVHAAYVSPDEDNQTVKYRRIQVTCPVISDLDTDNDINTTDAVLFSEYFNWSDSRADVNHDGQVNALDINAFSASYICGCNP